MYNASFKNTLFPRILLMLAIIVLSFIFGMKAFASPASEQEKIAYLLNAIASSDLTFIRNGNEYTGPEARDHLKMKLDFAGSRVQTADDFISGIASKSSVTGTPYIIRSRNGKETEADTWLREKLANMQQGGEQ